MSANVIVNDVHALISGSTVTSGDALDLSASNMTSILAFTGGDSSTTSAATMFLWRRAWMILTKEKKS